MSIPSFSKKKKKKKKEKKIKSFNCNFCKTHRAPSNESPIASQERFSAGENRSYSLAFCRPVSAAHPSVLPLSPRSAARNWQKRGRFVFRPAPSRSIKIRPVSRDVDAFSEAGWALPVRPGERRGRESRKRERESDRGTRRGKRGERRERQGGRGGRAREPEPEPEPEPDPDVKPGKSFVRTKAGGNSIVPWRKSSRRSRRDNNCPLLRRCFSLSPSFPSCYCCWLLASWLLPPPRVLSAPTSRSPPPSASVYPRPPPSLFPRLSLSLAPRCWHPPAASAHACLFPRALTNSDLRERDVTPLRRMLLTIFRLIRTMPNLTEHVSTHAYIYGDRARISRNEGRFFRGFFWGDGGSLRGF